MGLHCVSLLLLFKNAILQILRKFYHPFYLEPFQGKNLLDTYQGRMPLVRCICVKTIFNYSASFQLASLAANRNQRTQT